MDTTPIVVYRSKFEQANDQFWFDFMGEHYYLVLTVVAVLIVGFLAAYFFGGRK